MSTLKFKKIFFNGDNPQTTTLSFEKSYNNRQTSKKINEEKINEEKKIMCVKKLHK